MPHETGAVLGQLQVLPVLNRAVVAALERQDQRVPAARPPGRLQVEDEVVAGL
jgi:hypothetical protein